MRIGKFQMPSRLVHQAPKAALAVLQGLIVVRCEHMWHGNAFAYEAIGEQFEDVPAHSTAPEYEAEIRDLVGGKYHVTWKRL